MHLTFGHWFVVSIVTSQVRSGNSLGDTKEFARIYKFFGDTVYTVFAL